MGDHAYGDAGTCRQAAARMARARAMTVFASVLAALIVAPGLFLFIGFATHREPYIDEDVGSVEALKAEFRDYPEVLFPDMSRYDGGGKLHCYLYENPRYRHEQYRIAVGWGWSNSSPVGPSELSRIHVWCKELSPEDTSFTNTTSNIDHYGNDSAISFGQMDITDAVIDNNASLKNVRVRVYYCSFDIDGYHYEIEGEFTIATEDAGTKAEASRIAAAKEEMIHIAESIIFQKTGGGNA